MNKAYLASFHYLLGSQKISHTEAAGFEETCAHHKMPLLDEFWGWGDAYKATKSREKFIADGLMQLLTRVTKQGKAIDEVILCSPSSGKSDIFFDVVKKVVLPNIDKKQTALHYCPVGYCECNNVLAAIHLARLKTIATSSEHSTLIVIAEKIPDEFEGQRFCEYGFFSDYCMILEISSSSENASAEILDSLSLHHVGSSESETLSDLGRLEKQSVLDVLLTNSLQIRDVNRYYSLNLFHPVAQFKANNIGFDAQQIAPSHMVEHGHCFGMDPVYNFFTFPPKSGSYNVLNSFGLGQSVSVLLKSLI